MTLNRSTCRDCGQVIWWTKHAATGLPLQLDGISVRRFVLDATTFHARETNTYSDHALTCPDKRK